MSSQLNLLELYLNLKGPKVFRSLCTLSGFWKLLTSLATCMGWGGVGWAINILSTLLAASRRSTTDSETNGDSETKIQKLRFRNYGSETISTDSETITIQNLSRFSNYRYSMQKLPRFINYITSQTLYHDSETTIQKLAPFRNHDAETITNQKQARFRNYHDSETMIQKLPQFRNYRQSETIAIQKLSRFRNYPASETEDKMISKFPSHGTSNGLGLSTKPPPPMELQIDLHCPQGSGDIKIATPMELQIGLDCPQG